MSENTYKGRRSRLQMLPELPPSPSSGEMITCSPFRVAMLVPTQSKGSPFLRCVQKLEFAGLREQKQNIGFFSNLLSHIACSSSCLSIRFTFTIYFIFPLYSSTYRLSTPCLP